MESSIPLPSSLLFRDRILVKDPMASEMFLG